MVKFEAPAGADFLTKKMGDKNGSESITLNPADNMDIEVEVKIGIVGVGVKVNPEKAGEASRNLFEVILEYVKAVIKEDLPKKLGRNTDTSPKK